MNKINKANIEIQQVEPIKKFDKLYPFTTENITGYIDEFELKDKSLLTVGSSSDQAINAILKGCKDITILDSCIYTKEYFYLKAAAIETLTREEYLNFLVYLNNGLFGFNNIKAFNYNKFNKLKKTLKERDYESYCFWEELYKTNYDEMIRKGLFSDNEKNKRCIKGINPYLKTIKNYKHVKELICDIDPKFITGNILTKDIKNMYDNINLSNLIIYLNEVEKIILLNKMKKLLKENGKMLIAYLYNFDYESYDYILNLQKIIEGIINIHSFEGIESVERSEYIDKTDIILTYKKTR